MNKRRMRLAKIERNADLNVIREIQELYIKNLTAYKDQIRDANIKLVIKNCYKIAELFRKIEDDHDLFTSEWIKKETQTLEDKFYNSKYRNFGLEYETIQVAVHSQLRDIGGFDYCLDHKINIHHCSKCKVKLGMGEAGDQ